MATTLTEDAKAQIKAELLKCGEEVAKDAVDTIFDLIEIVVKDTDNKIDDTVLLALPAIRKYVDKLLDGISDLV